MCFVCVGNYVINYSPFVCRRTASRRYSPFRDKSVKEDWLTWYLSWGACKEILVNIAANPYLTTRATCKVMSVNIVLSPKATKWFKVYVWFDLKSCLETNLIKTSKIGQSRLTKPYLTLGLSILFISRNKILTYFWIANV